MCPQLDDILARTLTRAEQAVLVCLDRYVVLPAISNIGTPGWFCCAIAGVAAAAAANTAPTPRHGVIIPGVATTSPSSVRIVAVACYLVLRILNRGPHHHFFCSLACSSFAILASRSTIVAILRRLAGLVWLLAFRV
ncbi:hypothetical protein F4861DRAFT_505211 [Xylaria intraflava]|nr:hypothetical protein F4861DRAFT_505211 [Xylaria intraflava]